MKKLISVIVILMMISSVVFIFPHSAAALETRGFAGDNIIWTHDPDEKILVFTGEGPMYDYIDQDYFNRQYAPWSVYGNTAVGAVIGDGITTVGNKAFNSFSAIETVSIPDSVTRVAMDAFTNCASLDFTVYENGKYLGNGTNPYLVYVSAIDKTAPQYVIHPDAAVLAEAAMSNCDNMDSLVLPDGLGYLGYESVFACDSLTSITLPKDLIAADPLFCSSCYNLASMTIDGSNTHYMMADNCLINTDTDTLVLSINNAQIPQNAGIKVIGANSFRFGKLSGDIVIPDGVTRIGHHAFASSYDLTGASFPDSLEYIDDYAFISCSLTGVSLPDSVKYVGEYAFAYLGGASYIDLGEGVETIGDSAFYGEYEIYSPFLSGLPDSLKYIGNSAFRNVTVPDVLVIADGIEYIGANAFGGCGADRVIVPDKAIYFGQDVFFGCSLEFNEYENGYYLGSDSNPYALYYRVAVSGAEYCTIHSDTKAIAGDAFYNGDGRYNSADPPRFTSVEIPEGTEIIGGCAFANCPYIETVDLPSSLKIIGRYAFMYCSGIGCVEVPAGVVSIEDGAFRDCTSLSRAVLPDGLTELSAQIFLGCSSLTEAVLPQEVESMGDNAFGRCTSLETIAVPAGVDTLAKSVFYGCTSLQSVTLPAGIATVSDTAFSGCTALTDVYTLASPAEFENIVVGSYDDAFLAAEVHYGIPCDGTGHSLITVSSSEATCTEAGVTEFYCRGCGGRITETSPALGHDPDLSYTIDVQPTVSSDGSRSRHCLRCGAATDISPVRYKPGDADGDGAINQKDVSLFKYALAGTAHSSQIVALNIDVDGDGAVTVKDIMLIKRLGKLS